ncbi:NT-3 growth factor receptor-like, partial [Oscarella lobularis]|uniref:NT-3 growth factor receptor-like n=1 Tax=Oscarella lobularis TaxID=121494 RepID=UPI0033142FB7
LIAELTKHGDLKDYIRKSHPNDTHPRPALSIVQLVDIAAQAASGVAYLASRGFVHRDVAARNFVVGENGNKLTVKISDYGMAIDEYKDEYCPHKGAAMPTRWMAPEAIADEKHTVESDIWSLGVVLWEIFALGSLPYIGQSNDEVIDGILRGSLSLDRPSLCPRSVYQFMLRCWERNPSERIKSDDVANALKAMSDMGDISASHLAVSPASSKLSVGLDYMPMRTTPSGTKSYQPLLHHAYLGLCDDDAASSASTGQRRGTHLPDSQSESEESLDPTYEDPALVFCNKFCNNRELRGEDVPSASTGQKRSKHLADSQNESEESRS